LLPLLSTPLTQANTYTGFLDSKCLLYYYLGGEKSPIPCDDLRLPALAKVSFFEQKRPFNIVGLFKNPST